MNKEQDTPMTVANGGGVIKLLTDQDIINKVDKTTISPTASAYTYSKIAEITTNIGSGSADLTLLVAGDGNYGNVHQGTLAVNFGTRGSTNLDVYRLTPTGSLTIKFGYVVNAETGKSELWVGRHNFNNRTTITVLNSHNVTVISAPTKVATEPTDVTWVNEKLPNASEFAKYLPLTGGTVTGDLTIDKSLNVHEYFDINAWSGYGTGKTRLWYDGTNRIIKSQGGATSIDLKSTSTDKLATPININSMGVQTFIFQQNYQKCSMVFLV